MTGAFVESLGHRGDGIVRTEAGVLHVPKVLPGERIDLRDGVLVSVLEPSAERVEAFCAHYASCGGCKFQHWQEEPYRAWKRGLLLAALASQGIETDVTPLVDAHGAGRRRVTFHVRQIGGQWRAGFMEQKSHRLTALDSCPVLLPELQSAPQLAASFGPVLGNCDVAITAAANGIDVAIKAERQAVARRQPALMAQFHEQQLLRLSINGDAIASREPPVVMIGGAAVPLPVQSFLQATALGEATLTQLVLADMPKAKHVADLFGGLGTFALPLAGKTRVTSIDSDRDAVAALERAVRTTQGLKPLVAQLRNLFNAPLTFQELKDFDAAVLDPPRAGAETQSRQLAKSRVGHVAYVSCDPQTFARDAAILCEGGYQLLKATPVDQFKWTAHLELVAVFRKT